MSDVLGSIVEELKQDLRARLLERALSGDLSRFDKTLKELVEKEIEIILASASSPDYGHPIRDGVRRAVSEWAEAKTRELMQDPAMQESLQSVLRTSLSIAMNKHASEARFHLSVVSQR